MVISGIGLLVILLIACLALVLGLIGVLRTRDSSIQRSTTLQVTSVPFTTFVRFPHQLVGTPQNVFTVAKNLNGDHLPTVVDSLDSSRFRITIRHLGEKGEDFPVENPAAAAVCSAGAVYQLNSGFYWHDGTDWMTATPVGPVATTGTVLHTAVDSDGRLWTVLSEGADARRILWSDDNYATTESFLAGGPALHDTFGPYVAEVRADRFTVYRYGTQFDEEAQDATDATGFTVADGTVWVIRPGRLVRLDAYATSAVTLEGLSQVVGSELGLTVWGQTAGGDLGCKRMVDGTWTTLESLEKVDGFYALQSGLALVKLSGLHQAVLWDPRDGTTKVISDRCVVLRGAQSDICWMDTHDGPKTFAVNNGLDLVTLNYRVS